MVRVNDGVAAVTDGPFTEAKEVLAGYYLLPAARADFLRRLGRGDEARRAFLAALDLVPSGQPEQRFLRRRIAELS